MIDKEEFCRNKAIIHHKIVPYDLCSTERSDYFKLEKSKRIKYVGVGRIYSVKGKVQNDTNAFIGYHFWQKTCK